MGRKKLTRKKTSKKIKRPSDNMTDGIKDTQFGDELRAQQDGQQPSQPPSSVTPPNDGTDGSSFRDFLKQGDLARGQSENELTDKQRDVPVDRQNAFEAQQADQAQTTTEASQPEVDTSTESSVQGQDEMSKQTLLLTRLVALNDAMSVNLAAIAAAMEQSSDGAVRLGSSG